MTTTQFFRGTLVVLMTLIGAYVLFISLRILIVFVIAIIIASAVRPLVQGLVRWRVPQSIAIIIVYLGLAIFIIGIFVAILPPIINQVALYVENEARLALQIIRAQSWIEEIISDVTNEDVTLVQQGEVRAAVSDFVAQIRAVAPSMVSDIGNTLGDAVLIFVMGAYWLTSHDKATEFISQLSPLRYRNQVHAIFDEVENTMGGYVRGVATIATIVGILNFSTLQLLSVPNAITIAFIIAITTTIPMIGGFLGGVISVFLTLVTAPEYVPIVFVTFFTITQIENYILTPRIMSNSVGIDPLLVIVYTSIGFVMSGIIGALIALPIMGTIHILLMHLVVNPHRESMKSYHTEDGVILMNNAPNTEEKIKSASNNLHLKPNTQNQ